MEMRVKKLKDLVKGMEKKDNYYLSSAGTINEEMALKAGEKIKVQLTSITGYNYRDDNGYLWRKEWLEPILKEGDRVYVSDESEEDAVSKLKERTFIFKSGISHFCVEGNAESDYKANQLFDVTPWKYVVKTEETISITVSQYERVKHLL